MRDHKHLLAWQRAREVVIEVQRITDRIWRPSYAAMIWQLQKASLSVQLNVAEGHALGTPRLFVRHVTIAYGSAVEATEIIELLEELSEREAEALHSLAIRARRNCALVLALKHGLERKLKQKE
jgi:four helix bundle protein